MTRVSPRWLALREPADAAARARELADRVDRLLPTSGRRVIHDLGSGTGSMVRWLAPLLTGPQHWVAHDRDTDLLALAAASPSLTAADGAPVTIEVRPTDLARADAGEFADADLITASALLDILTADEVADLSGACAGVGCPALLTLSVTGHVELTPGEPLDEPVGAAFNAHQRRTVAHGRLLGPDAVSVTVDRFRALGAEVLTAASPWRLGPPEAELIAEWLTGWVAAAGEQDAELADACAAYAARRLAQVNAGELRVTVGHADLLLVP